MDEQEIGRMRVLIVDDEEIDLKNLSRILKKEGFQVAVAQDGARALRLLREAAFDLVVTDLIMGEVDGLDILAEAKKQDPETEVVLVSGYATVDSAVEATKKGAFHYLQKPMRPGEVRSIVGQAARKRLLARRVRELEQDLHGGFPEIIGNHPTIEAVKKLIPQVAASESNVLVTGGSGTGKELAARAIHRASPRARGPFLAVNCASFAEDLLANELFGHEKEAFTGANKARAGLLESATGGSVFLDEVGDMTPGMQAKLLRVIQEKEVIRVGGNRPIEVDIRVISATNKDLKKMCDLGSFRLDLFYRLNVIGISLPTLAERKEDIPVLATHFLRRFEKRMEKAFEGFSDEVLGILTQYGYPGNVRELENIVEHACSMAPGGCVGVEHLPADLRDVNAFTFHQDRGPVRTLEEVERDYIRWVLEKAGHNKSQAARMLGIDRVSLYRKLKRLEFLE